MKQVLMESYEAPQIEVLEIEVEKGFAGSGSTGEDGNWVQAEMSNW